MNKADIKETDLYLPVSDLLEGMGYLVRSEVKDCDISALRGDLLIIVELKTSVNIRLLSQAVERLSLTQLVYIAVPDPSKRSSHWRGIIKLVKMLGLGLILVSFGQTGSRARIEFDPHEYRPGINKKKSRAVRNEALNRSGEHNIGGSNRTKILTSYRESAIFLACCLEKYGQLSPRELKALGSGEKTQSMLSKNHYGWFDNISRGTYRLSESGCKGIQEYPEIYQKSRSLLDSTDGS